MKDISVEQLAKIVGTPEDKILLQMKEAGLSQSLSSDLVSDKDKKILLKFLKGQQNKSSKTISLKKKASVEPLKKTKTIAIKRKRTKALEADDDVIEDPNRIENDAIYAAKYLPITHSRFALFHNYHLVNQV